MCKINYKKKTVTAVRGLRFDKVSVPGGIPKSTHMIGPGSEQHGVDIFKICLRVGEWRALPEVGLANCPLQIS